MIRGDIRLGPNMRDVDVGYQPVQVAILQVGRSLKTGLSTFTGSHPYCVELKKFPLTPYYLVATTAFSKPLSRIYYSFGYKVIPG